MLDVKCWEVTRSRVPRVKGCLTQAFIGPGMYPRVVLISLLVNRGESDDSSLSECTGFAGIAALSF